MKNLARTLSLFLIFCRNFYKSEIRNIVYKVFIKQTKNQSTYSFAGQKLSVNTGYIAY